MSQQITESKNTPMGRKKSIKIMIEKAKFCCFSLIFYVNSFSIEISQEKTQKELI